MACKGLFSQNARMERSGLQIRWAQLRALGPAEFVRAALSRRRHRTVSCAPEIAEAAAGANAIEIGGPSGIFLPTGLAPVYPFLRRLDDVNFASKTLWDSASQHERSSRISTLTQNHVIAEAGHLEGVESGSYDLVLASHVLEHTANPLATLREWRRVCREGGAMVLVLPHRDAAFDRFRPITTLEHLLEDDDRGTTEDDRTHVEEVRRLHDRRLDHGFVSEADFARRLDDNFSTRSLHHHVFDVGLAMRATEAAGWTLVAAEARRPHDILILARNGPPAERAAVRAVFRGSSFPSDRKGPVSKVGSMVQGSIAEHFEEEMDRSYARDVDADRDPIQP